MEKCDISDSVREGAPCENPVSRPCIYALRLKRWTDTLPYIRFGWITQSHIDAAAAVTPMALGIFFHILGRTTKGE